MNATALKGAVQFWTMAYITIRKRIRLPDANAPKIQPGDEPPRIDMKGLLGIEAPPPRLISVAEAADRLAVDKATVYRLAKRGRLRKVRVGARGIRIELQSLIDFIAGKR